MVDRANLIFWKCHLSCNWYCCQALNKPTFVATTWVLQKSNVSLLPTHVQSVSCGFGDSFSLLSVCIHSFLCTFTFHWMGQVLHTARNNVCIWVVMYYWENCGTWAHFRHLGRCTIAGDIWEQIEKNKWRRFKRHLVSAVKNYRPALDDSWVQMSVQIIIFILKEGGLGEDDIQMMFLLLAMHALQSLSRAQGTHFFLQRNGPFPAWQFTNGGL